MLHKTRGIVFKCTDYAENSVIVQVFTEKFGMQSYLINGVKKSKGKIRRNMLQPMHLLDMVVYHKSSGNIQRIAELRNDPVFHTLPYNILKSSIALFLNEVLYKVIKQQSAEESLFEYIFNAVNLLDKLDYGLANFHLYFLLRLTRYLGFYPDISMAEQADYFDLHSGSFQAHAPAHRFVLQQPHTTYWALLLKSSFETLHKLQIPLAGRRVLLSKLLDYYRLHMEGFGEIHSFEILEEVLS